MVHYIAMSGMRGCLPDYCHAHDTLDAAVDDLANLFDLDQQERDNLEDGRYLDLGMGSGAEYCEIEEWSEIHDDE